MKKPVYYRGRGFDELYKYVSNNGTMVGEIQRNTGDHVASVEISVQNKELILEVNGQTFSSITNALTELYPDLAVNAADGSEGSGNIANNVIGNYAILKHVVFGNITMEDIVGASIATHTPRKPRSSTKTKKAPAVTVNISELPARGNLYSYFKRDAIVGIARAMGGPEAFQASLEGKTIKQFAQEHNLSV
jgi:hypothetical protein